jgi:hypothetical protein
VTAQGPVEAPPRGRGCLFRGCLVTLSFVVGIGVATAALVLRIPQQVGLIPTAETLLADTPDREGAAELMASIEASGIDTTGMSLLLLPMRDGDAVIAYAVLDTSAGFRFPAATDRPGLIEMFVRLSDGRARELGVTRVAVDYRDGTGKSLGLLTASASSIARVASGQDDLETFSRSLDGRVDVGAVLAGATVQ